MSNLAKKLASSTEIELPDRGITATLTEDGWWKMTNKMSHYYLIGAHNFTLQVDKQLAQPAALHSLIVDCGLGAVIGVRDNHYNVVVAAVKGGARLAVPSVFRHMNEQAVAKTQGDLNALAEELANMDRGLIIPLATVFIEYAGITYGEVSTRALAFADSLLSS